jgi:hypothetical protein
MAFLIKLRFTQFVNNCLLLRNRKSINMFTEPHLGPVVRKLHELYTFMSYFSKFYFNIVLLSMPMGDAVP